MQFPKEDVTKLNMCFDLLIDKMCCWMFLDSCCENFVIFIEKYLWRSLLLRKLHYVKSQFLELSALSNTFLWNLRNVQRNYGFKSGPRNVI